MFDVNISPRTKPRASYPEPPTSPVSPLPPPSAFQQGARRNELTNASQQVNYDSSISDHVRLVALRIPDHNSQTWTHTNSQQNMNRPLASSECVQTVPARKSTATPHHEFALPLSHRDSSVPHSSVQQTLAHTGPSSPYVTMKSAGEAVPSHMQLHRSLDVLATVSAEQRKQLPTIGLPQQPVASLVLTSTPMSMPLTPATPVTPVTSKECVSQSRSSAPTVQELLTAPASPLDSPRRSCMRSRGTSATKTLSKLGRSRSFACTQCASTFSERFNLNKHVRAVHERRRPFQCSTCHARFQQKDHMQKHEICVHKKLRQYSCVTCGAAFGWRGVLKKHRKSVHNIVDI